MQVWQWLQMVDADMVAMVVGKGSPVGRTTTEERGRYNWTTFSKADEIYPGQHHCS